jgi:hypothetical protein
MMNSEHYIEETNMSIAWAKAIMTITMNGRREFAPLIVAMTGFDDRGEPQESPPIRSALEQLLGAEGKQTVETVAGTIFPYHLWNRKADRSQLFERYAAIVPRLRTASTKNKHGIYFERMITGGPTEYPNQLDFVIGAYESRPGVRRSMFQIGIFDPEEDLTNSAQRGFPCLQHVTFAPVGNQLSVNAFYATQYMFERAYGNYLGICRLGQFVAHEMGLALGRVTCYAGVAMCDIAKGKLSDVLTLANECADKSPGGD